ncbi:hypothetical protein SCHPADRAFT_701475 [Schizopora paradoxa]|uniref:Uncharacterized protein n=1 Tax=Schizopora paradoxa TaxID=27342 RepID=A0A0H2R2R0_9AGAM|nr:hypothetical protein SCHPADRAFT_701475 [Schizopora paradoxa]
MPDGRMTSRIISSDFTFALASHPPSVAWAGTCTSNRALSRATNARNHQPSFRRRRPTPFLINYLERIVTQTVECLNCSKGPRCVDAVLFGRTWYQNGRRFWR